MGNDKRKRLSSPDGTGIASGSNERRLPRSRSANTSGGSSLRTPSRRTEPRSTQDRASVVSSGSRVNGNRISPRRRANQTNRCTRRSVSLADGPNPNRAPISPAYSPTSPAYAPNANRAPVSPNYSPTSPAYREGKHTPGSARLCRLQSGLSCVRGKHTPGSARIARVLGNFAHICAEP